MIEVLCEKTGYDADEIEPDFELEADLGIDTVKQAEIMATVRDHYGFAKDDEFRLAEYPTLEDLARYIVERVALEGGEGTRLEAASPQADIEAVSSREVGAAASSRDLLSHGEALDKMIEVLCEKTGYDADEIEPDFELEADLGIDTVKQAEIMATVRDHYGFAKDDEFRLAEYPTLDDLARYIVERVALEGVEGTRLEAASPQADIEAVSSRDLDAKEIVIEAPAAAAAFERKPAPPVEVVSSPKATAKDGRVPAEVVIAGCSLGLPGQDELFADDSVDRLLRGENMIGDISAEDREAMATKKITRLVKHEDGSGVMVPVDDVADVLKLAGRKGKFDLGEWEIPDRWRESLDRTTEMAIAAGLLALQDAGLPLVPKYRTTTSGKKLTIGWTLPPEIGDRTGVIYASAFSGQDALIDEIQRSYEDPEYEFDHRYLLKVLGIANSRFAELVGARGPNTKINNACASTTTAIAIAEDWIKAGRCERVIVMGADDASGESLMEWIGSGFLATGAATTESDVENAALPFDKRRNGIIIGMGAVGIVVEKAGLCEERGIEPIADLLGTRFVNSAEHPTRLDVDHIADEVGALIGAVEQQFGIDRHDIADRTVFVSHETYSPARGGSAATEIESLRRTFGDDASDVVIANTKGFTGHAMAAGIEDVLALKALQREQLPHIANFKEPDPLLGDLRLSQGGKYELDYALRLAAGFGSQLALALFRFRARTEDRLVDADRFDAWAGRISGFENPETVVEARTLRMREGAPKETSPEPKRDERAPTPATLSIPAPASSPRASRAHAGPGEFDQLGVVVEAHAVAPYATPALRKELEGKSVAVIAGPLVVTELMVRALERCGAKVAVFEGRERRNLIGGEGDYTVVDLLDEQALGDEFAAMGRVDGVVNLLGFGPDRFKSSDVYLAARESFHVARAWRFSLGEAPTRENFFLTVTGMGGRLGFDRASGPLPVCGAVGGFTKALAREWAEAKIRVVDVARQGIVPDLGLQVLSETMFGSGVEVGLIAGIRYTPATVPASEITPETLPSMAPEPDDVVVVTGGAKGITAEVAVDLARRFGCALALVGRTPLTHDDPLGVDLDAEKKRVKAELSKTNDRVTPLMIRQAMWSLESQRTIASNMERMREAGSDVDYFACDVADEASVAEMIERVHERFGRIDGIIHGAGVEESRLIEDKDVAGFDRVFRGKALGALHLWNAVEKHGPRFYMAFSSVAGRFGNPGQVDYAAANEVLNKLVALLNHDGKTRATSIDWTAWDEVGMAAEGSMKTLLEARGVQLLPPEVGAPMVGDFLENGLSGEFVVAGELGDFAIESSDAREPAEPLEILLSTIRERSEERVVVSRVFDLDQDVFLRDHVYEGNPVVPGVMGFEMMVEAARLLGLRGAVVTDVRFEHAIKLHRGEPVELVATAERDGDGATVTIRTFRVTKTGREIETVHYRATVSDSEPRLESFAIEDVAGVLEGPERDAIYGKYFHTGVFQVLDEVPWVGDDFVVGYGRRGRDRLVNARDNDAFVTDPMVREMAFQAAGLWGMTKLEMSYLPYSIDRAETFASARDDEQVVLRCTVRDDADEHMIAFDVEALGQDGRLLQRMERVQLVGHRKLTEEERFDQLAAHRLRTRRLTVREAEAVLDARNMTIANVADETERAAYDRLISERRKGEWLAARVALKSLVVEWLRDFRGVSIAPGDVRIRKDEKKAPYLEVDGQTDLPGVTISHCAGSSICGINISPGRATAGLDLEAIEQRDESFARNYFSPSELRLDVGGDGATLLAALWSVKEAVSKALRIGLHARLEEFEVNSLRRDHDGWVADVTLKGMALDAYRSLGGTGLDVRVDIGENEVLATALLEVSPGMKNKKMPTTVDSDAVARETKSGPPAPRNAERAELELAAVAALLQERGLLKARERSMTPRTHLPAWKG